MSFRCSHKTIFDVCRASAHEARTHARTDRREQGRQPTGRDGVHRTVSPFYVRAGIVRAASLCAASLCAGAMKMSRTRGVSETMRCDAGKCVCVCVVRGGAMFTPHSRSTQ